ncbi:MAG: flavodoxin FldB [Cellvibrio sp.]
MKVGIYYASTSGNTEIIAEQIAQVLDAEFISLHDMSSDKFDGHQQFDLLIFGAPTWDYGHLQSDWEALWTDFLGLELNGKAVAIYGLGDQYGYAEWYLDAMGMVYEALIDRGARVIGFWPNEGYQFESSKALTSDRKYFVGLALDEESQSLLTKSRLENWCFNLVQEYTELESELCL